MTGTKTDSYILELPLRVSSIQEQRLLARLEAARQVYNACLGESLKRLALKRQSKAYQAAKKLPKGKARTKAFRDANAAARFHEYDLHAYAKQFNHCWLGEHLDINTIQKLATRAFKAVQQYGFGRHGRPRFKGRNQMDSVEGKTNKQGIRWREPRIEWLGLRLEAIVDEDDPVIAHGLASRVKYARLVRRKLNGRSRFYVQLVCEGKPYQKPKNQVGEGDVGLDLGPSTIATVGEREAFLARFCDELLPRRKDIRRLQRQIDRQRRANNPDCYDEKGRAIKGKRPRRKSARQRKVEAKLAELHRKQAAHRKSLHGRMVNRVLRMGNVIKLEKLSYRAFQRQYGRSVGMRAPGMFIAHLRRKAKACLAGPSAGALVVEFPTRTTRLSQTCHGCGSVEKKPLSQRWHVCDCGIEAQRDLYSAFLARCVEGERLNADRAKAAWSGADALLQAALSDIQPVSGRHLPSSFGLGQSRNRSPVKSSGNSGTARIARQSLLGLHAKASKAQDVVPPSSLAVGELEKARRTARTPGL